MSWIQSSSELWLPVLLASLCLAFAASYSWHRWGTKSPPHWRLLLGLPWESSPASPSAPVATSTVTPIPLVRLRKLAAGNPIISSDPTPSAIVRAAANGHA
jgi:hypothetical protein